MSTGDWGDIGDGKIWATNYCGVFGRSSRSMPLKRKHEQRTRTREGAAAEDRAKGLATFTRARALHATSALATSILQLLLALHTHVLAECDGAG